MRQETKDILAKIEEVDSDPEVFVVYREGICYASVCSSLGMESTVKRMRTRPSGITHGWQLADKPFRTGESNPCPCDQQPKTHMHYLFEC